MTQFLIGNDVLQEDACCVGLARSGALCLPRTDLSFVPISEVACCVGLEAHGVLVYVPVFVVDFSVSSVGGDAVLPRADFSSQ